MRTYARRLPESRERFARACHELNILVENYSTAWRAWRLGWTQGGASPRHLRVLAGGGA